MGEPRRMASGVSRGEIWLYTFKPPDKRRPVLILTRPDAIRWLNTVMVAPITSSIRGAPSEVLVGIEEGLKGDSAVNLDHVQTVPKQNLQHFIDGVSPEKMAAVCRALAIAVACD